MKEQSQKYFKILEKFDTPTVCNVIELFNVQPRSWGFTDGSIKSLYPQMPPIVGYATTATYRSADPAGEEDVYSNFVDQVERFDKELPRPRIVVIQDLDENPCGATFGEVMCSVYQSFGCLGLITSGGARDLDQVEQLGFSCFARSVIASHAYCRIIDVHVPVTIGGCLVRPGDVIHADRNGVTTIPSDLVPEVALGCEKFVEAEGEVFTCLKKDTGPDIAALKKATQRMRQSQAQIVEEVRRELAS